MYKSQLQEFAQKAGLMRPTYNHVREGAPHDPRFKATVVLNDQSYESTPGFLTVRSAEHAAAKAALDFLQKTQTSGIVPSSVHESGLCKNLLQEYAQKHGHPLPRYNVTREGHEHSLMFSAKVEIAGVLYSGGAAKSKKEAEIKAARTALCAIEATQPQAIVTAPIVQPLPVIDPKTIVEGPPGVDPQPVVAPAFPFPGPVPVPVSFNKKRNKKRGRVNPAPVEEPLASRMKQFIPGPVQAPQIPMPEHQMPQVPQVAQIPNMLPVAPVN